MDSGGGYLLVTTPAQPYLFGAFDRYVHHVRRYTKLDLATKIQSSGLKIVTFWSIGFPVANITTMVYQVISRGTKPRERSDIGIDKPGARTIRLAKKIIPYRILWQIADRFLDLPLGAHFIVLAQKPRDAEAEIT